MKSCVDKAMKLIKVEYEVLEPVLDFTKGERIIKFSFILKIPGNHFVLSELTTKEIFVHMMRVVMEI